LIKKQVPLNNIMLEIQLHSDGARNVLYTSILVDLFYIFAKEHPFILDFSKEKSFVSGACDCHAFALDQFLSPKSGCTITITLAGL